MKHRLFGLRNIRRLLVIAMCLLLAIGIIGTTAFFVDRVSHKMNITTGKFTLEGYSLTRDAPVGPFIAGENVSITLYESNTGVSELKSSIHMSAKWTCYDPNVSIFGNSTVADNATLTISGDGFSQPQTINYTVSSNGTISFVIPDHLLSAGASKKERVLTLNIPESLYSTGEISFSFDNVKVDDTSSDIFLEYNPDTTMDCNVRVGWAASNLSTHNGKALMGYLTPKDANGMYGIEFNFEFNYTESAMKDFSSRTGAKWSHYSSTVNRLEFENGMTTFGDYVFPDFEAVTSIIIPESITAVGTYAFDNTSLHTLVIPASVVKFEAMSFGHINELTQITFNDSKNKNIEFPTAGSSTGAFYVYPYVDTIIYSSNDDASNYDWIKDLRNPPTLAAGRQWIDTDLIGYFSNPVTEVKFVTRYTPTGNETAVWNAAIDRNGDGANDDDIICYLNDTVLTFYAHTATRIYTNENSYRAFYGFSQTTGYDNIEMLDTRKTTDMGGMFSDNFSVTDLEVGHFIMDNVTNISQMFYICYDLPYLDVSNWDTGNVTDMFGVFSDCMSLTEIEGIQNWDTRNVTTTASMFDGVSAMESLDLSSKQVTINGKTYDSWDTGNVVNMTSMFGNTDSRDHALKELNISTFDTRNVTTLKHTFERCRSLITLDVTPKEITLNGDTFYTWDTGNVESFYATFRNCNSLKSLDLSGWDTHSIGLGENYSDDDFIEMFMGCSSLETLDVSRKEVSINGRTYTSWDTSNAVFMTSMFEGCSSLKSLNLKNWTNTLVEYMGSMFEECSSMTSINLEGFTTPSVDYMSAMFYNCSSLESIDVRSFDTSNAFYMVNVFSYCSSLTELDLSNWDTTTGGRYFYSFAQHCTSLTDITLGANFGIGSIPAAGTDGLFYVETNLPTTVRGFNNTMYGYNWSLDNRTVTFEGPVYIEASQQPSKTTYVQGENFDSTGMSIAVRYGDGSLKTLSSGEYTILDGANLPVGKTSVTVSFTDSGKTMTCQIPIQVGYKVTYMSGNGTFNGSATSNDVTYSLNPSKITAISKTDNINDDGSAIKLNYGVDKTLVDVITIPGATSLEVTVTYQTESTSYDWVAVYDKTVVPTTSNSGSSISGKLGGTTTNTSSFIVPGDTAQFLFRSDGSACSYYGYYAVITGIGETQVLSGEYSEPTLNNSAFGGWYTDSECTDGNEFDLDNLSGNITVYATYLARLNAPAMSIGPNNSIATNNEDIPLDSNAFEAPSDTPIDSESSDLLPSDTDTTPSNSSELPSEPDTSDILEPAPSEEPEASDDLELVPSEPDELNSDTSEGLNNDSNLTEVVSSEESTIASENSISTDTEITDIVDFTDIAFEEPLISLEPEIN